MAIGGWQDSGGDWHSGEPDFDPWEADALRVSYTDDAGDEQWTTILGPFPDFYDEAEFDDYITDWLDENDYGEN